MNSQDSAAGKKDNLPQMPDNLESEPTSPRETEHRSAGRDVDYQIDKRDYGATNQTRALNALTINLESEYDLDSGREN